MNIVKTQIAATAAVAAGVISTFPSPVRLLKCPDGAASAERLRRRKGARVLAGRVPPFVFYAFAFKFIYSDGHLNASDRRERGHHCPP
jgi:hypothetical protein